MKILHRSRNGKYYITEALAIMGGLYNVYEMVNKSYSKQLAKDLPLDEAKEVIEKRLRQDEF